MSIRYRGLALAAFLQLVTTSVAVTQSRDDAFRIGWIGSLTGPLAKYGAGQAALIAQDDVNRDGGVLGKKLELVMEDGQASGMVSVSAFQKLTSRDRLKFIVGGHCTPETAPIAPLASKAGVVVLAAITTSPQLTAADSNFFRVSAVSLIESQEVARYARERAGLKSAAVLTEQTDYALPLAREFARVFTELGGTVSGFDEVVKGEMDIRQLATKIRFQNVEAVFLSTQSQEFAAAAVQQLRQAGVKAQFLGNASAGNTAGAFPAERAFFKGMIFAEPPFDRDNPATKRFIEAYKERFKVSDLTYGYWTAEAYDAVRLLAKTINDVGDDVDAVKMALLNSRGYQGISGAFSLNDSHDAVRGCQLKVVGADGTIKRLAEN